MAGIYIHIPFCARKCVYCNFNTTDYHEDLVPAYIEATAREIACRGERENRVTVDTIYFGGGTPSIVEAADIDLLVRTCRDSFDVAPDAEITIEINPSTLSRRKLYGWLKAGINRASVGVQSFIESDLVSLS
ncbi:MAG TPA: radical SAM protein, partial [Blastocatellia bacterium]|nr:radical SAM protein [Blastocatellia bacterium]